MLRLYSRLKGVQKEKIFLISMLLITFFALLYYISDYPLELKRRKDNTNVQHRELHFLDYFIFSLGTWATVSPKENKFNDLNWSRNSYYIYICQLIMIIGSWIFLFV